MVALPGLQPTQAAQPPLPIPYYQYALEVVDPITTNAIGSGFMLQASNSVYFVTARHVLFELSTSGWQLSRPQIEISGFTAHSKTNENQTVLIVNLQSLLRKGEVRFSTNRDVALPRLEYCNLTNKNFQTILPEVSAKTTNHVLCMCPETLMMKYPEESFVGNDVFLVGFPASIGISELPQIDSTRPLLRKGIVAGLNQSRRTIILDCPVYQGNSGGPVVTKEQVNINTWYFPILGIAVEWVPFRDVWESKRFKYTNQTLSNSGYAVVEPAEAILEMVWQ